MEIKYANVDAKIYPQSIEIIPKLKHATTESKIRAFLIISIRNVILDFPREFNALTFSE